MGGVNVGDRESSEALRALISAIGEPVEFKKSNKGKNNTITPTDIPKQSDTL